MDTSSEKRIHNFVEACRKRTDTKTGNILNTSFHPWLRYCRFIGVIRERYEETGKTYMAVTERSLEAAKQSPGTHRLTPEEWEEHQRSYDLGLVLHLEIESFYVFAKLLLDRIADTFGYYFGVTWHKFGSSYVKLTGQFEQICAAKDLTLQYADLPKILHDLRERIVEYRTDVIEHVSDPRLLRGTSWGADKKPKIITSPLYPSESEFPQYEQKETENLDELITMLEQYIAMMVDFFETNWEKSVLRESVTERAKNPAK